MMSSVATHPPEEQGCGSSSTSSRSTRLVCLGRRGRRRGFRFMDGGLIMMPEAPLMCVGVDLPPDCE